MAEREKYCIFENLSRVESNLPHAGTKSLPRSMRMGATGMQKQAFLKKMLKEAKEEAEFLHKENTRLKKVVKYTQISELKIQNEHLAD